MVIDNIDHTCRSKRDMIAIMKQQQEEIKQLQQRVEEAERLAREYYALADERANYIISASNMPNHERVYVRCKLPTHVAAKKLSKRNHNEN